MSKLFDKFISKILAVIIIVLFIFGFREMILTDKNTADAFGALMGTLPFAKVIADVICKIMKYQYNIPVISTAGVISDFLRLAVMACIQPLAVGLLSVIFLRVPDGDYREKEKYMEGPAYRIKELILTVVTAPLIAIAASYLTSYVSDYINSNFGPTASVVLGIAAVVGISAVSLIPLLIAGVSIGTAIIWRLLVTLLYGMAATCVTNALCLWIYATLVAGMKGQTAAVVLTLIIWLIVMDFAMQCLKRVIVA